MIREVWDGATAVLADTSAWTAAGGRAECRARMRAAGERRHLAWCWPVRYELMLHARDAGAIADVERTLEALREIAVERSVQRGVLAAMRDLARGGSHGAHRFPLTDLTVAVAAQRHGLAVLHFDRHFDRLGPLLGVRTLWIAKP